MNKTQRLEAAERIRAVHNLDAVMGHPDPRRAELLTLLADAERDVDDLESAHKTSDENRSYWQTKCVSIERENDKLRKYAHHLKHCMWLDPYDERATDCTCGLDDLLKQEPDK